MKSDRPHSKVKRTRKPTSERTSDSPARPGAPHRTDSPRKPWSREGAAPRDRSSSGGRPEYPRKPWSREGSESRDRPGSAGRPEYPRKPWSRGEGEQRERGTAPGGPSRSPYPRKPRSDGPPRSPRKYGPPSGADSPPRGDTERRYGESRDSEPRRSTYRSDRPERPRRTEHPERPGFGPPRERRPRPESRRPSDDAPRPDRFRAEEREEPREPFKPRPPRVERPRPTDEHPDLFRVYGRKPVLEVLRLELVRSLEVHRNAHGRPIEEILRIADEQHIRVTRVESFPDEEELTIQGVQAFVQPPLMRDDLRRFVRELPASPPPLMLMLDGITDPHNYGAILRAADGAGVSGVIVRERRQVPVTDVVVKSSAGAAYLIPIFQVVNLSQTLGILSHEGFWSVAAISGGNARLYSEYNWNAKTVLLVGAEGTGVSDLLSREADDRIAIPMIGTLESLNVSVATGVLLFEAAKTRFPDKKS